MCMSVACVLAALPDCEPEEMVGMSQYITRAGIDACCSGL